MCCTMFARLGVSYSCVKKGRDCAIISPVMSSGQLGRPMLSLHRRQRAATGFKVAMCPVWVALFTCALLLQHGRWKEPEEEEEDIEAIAEERLEKGPQLV